MVARPPDATRPVDHGGDGGTLAPMPSRLGVRAIARVVAPALLVACAPEPDPTGPGVATVVRVVDGDTIVVRVGGDQATVRLIGIDTPETHHPDRPVECHGPEASARLTELVPAGSQVRLTRDVELHDVHGRVLAYVTRLPDGLDVNLAMVAEGHADTLRIPPNTANAAAVAAAAADARAGGVGLWGHCAEASAPAVP